MLSTGSNKIANASAKRVMRRRPQLLGAHLREWRVWRGLRSIYLKIYVTMPFKV